MFMFLLLKLDRQSRKSIQLRRWFKEPTARGIYPYIANIFSIKYVIYPNVRMDLGIARVEATTKSYIRDHIMLGFSTIGSVNRDLVNILCIKNGV